MTGPNLSIWYYIKNYKFKSIFLKNFLLIFFLIVLPLTGISVFVYNYYGNVFREEIGTAHREALFKVRDMVDMVCGEVDRLSVRIASDRDVEEYIKKPDAVFKDSRSVDILNKVMGTITISTSEYINSIYVYSGVNQFVLSSTHGPSELSFFYDQDWKAQYEKTQGTGNTLTIPRQFADSIDTSIKYDFISLFTNAPLLSEVKNGVIVINIDAGKFRQFISNIGGNSSEEVYIINPQGMVLLSASNSYTGNNVNEISFLKDFLKQDVQKNPVIKDIDGMKKVISVTDSKYNHWQYISLISLEKYQQKIIYLKRFMIMLIILSGIAAVIIGFAISVKVFTPIRSIMALIEKPNGLNGVVQAETEKDLNEYKFIVSKIIKTLDQNKHMEQELEDRITMFKKAQASALQAQINPHFLYNTLQTLNWLVIGMTKSENPASVVIESLSHILRGTMETDNYLIPIDNEISLCKEYIEIQKIRYKNKFEIIWEVDAGIVEFLIPKITLQPMIENSIYHGIKPMKEAGKIKVKGYAEQDKAVLEVIDNGIGMSEEEAAILNQKMHQSYTNDSKHIGLMNINQRIKLIFGEEYGASINIGPARETHVKIIIPIVKQSDLR